MLGVDLGHFQKIRVWIGECPGAQFLPVGQVEVQVPAEGISVAERTLAVEMALGRGATVLYGLVGATHRGLLVAEALTLSIGYGDVEFGKGREYRTPFASSPERPVIGMPRELAQPVLGGMQLALQEGADIGRGRLSVACAAHGAVGSTAYVFRLLGMVIVRLLAHGPDIHEKELRSLLRGVIK